MNRGDKSGQMKISFGMIFSIILIIAFLGFAIYAIMTLLEIIDNAKIAKFVEDLQGDVDKMYFITIELENTITINMLEDVLKLLAVVLLAPFVIVAAWVALIIITSLFALSMKIVFIVGGALAVVAVIGFILQKFIEKYNEQSLVGGTSGDN